MSQLCPCHSQKNYADCCKTFHNGVPAPSALLLMRSRYSAYALGNAKYIIDTTSPLNPEAQKFSKAHQKKEWTKQILQFSKNTIFQDLKILHFEEKAFFATVTFTAVLKQSYRDATFTEESLFEKKENKWLYVGRK